MWTYQKVLQYPVKIARRNPRLAKYIMSQFGGPDGELGASTRYLSQRYAMPYREGIATLTDIGTEELAHFEMVNALVYQLTKGSGVNELENAGLAEYYVDHTLGQYPQSAGGIPFTAAAFQSKGDPITDLHEDMAAEQKARTTYDNLIRIADDPDVKDVLRFLRAREIVHYQRFGETLRTVQDRLDANNYYRFNPAFDRAGAGKRYNGNTGEAMYAEGDCCPVNRAAVREEAEIPARVRQDPPREHCPAREFVPQEAQACARTPEYEETRYARGCDCNDGCEVGTSR